MKEFKVGDRVRIRSWESMEKEFGTFAHGSIKATYSFSQSMHNLCGLTATISGMDGKRVYLEDWNGDTVDTFWSFSTDMIEPALPRICYLLGGEDTPLKIGEEFNYMYNGSDNTEQILLHDLCVDKSGNIGRMDNQALLAHIINHPEKIIRKPKMEFSDDEKAFMRLLVKEGYKWIARGKDNTLAVFGKKPKLVGYDDGTFIPNDDTKVDNLPENLLTQIAYENSPVKMEDNV